ncbi:MAG: flavodoxin-dependent (E)-4-hydroxy-3-methylbut-2-enyl-diphosphate synthase, partial [Spirochaetales bacterium]|nr:flavodoxin-dependent (E)-4-hydroxy-3-methylbut-2-enyl-diphosphate synthase [Candidatus Physcosoma equi]
MNSKRIAMVRGLGIGGENPVRVQTMYDNKISTIDPAIVVEKINTLSLMGCDLIRFSFVSLEDKENFAYICKHSPIPVVADIHFDYKMALAAMDAGADKIRINPGNIGDKWKTETVVKTALDKGVAIRIGLNMGSLPRHEKDADPVKLMVDTSLDYLNDFESWGFENTVVSLKSSDTEKTVKAAELFAS